MIVCVCRRLNCSKIGAAIQCGATTPAGVLAHHGERFNCGKCRTTIADMISENRPAVEDTAEPVMLAAE